jgi:hypothetical protein
MNLQFQRQMNQITIMDLINFDLTIIYGLYQSNSMLSSFYLSFNMYILSGLSFIKIYQHSGDARKPYLAQYSAHVSEVEPVSIS